MSEQNMTDFEQMVRLAMLNRFETVEFLKRSSDGNEVIFRFRTNNGKQLVRMDRSKAKDAQAQGQDAVDQLVGANFS